MSSNNTPLLKMRNVLVIRLDRIGDFVLTTPFFREFKRNAPRSNITLLTTKETYPIAKMCPSIDNVLVFDTKHTLLSKVPEKKLSKFIKRSLWAKKFDIAIVPRWDIDYYGASLLAYLSNARIRVGYSEKVNRDKQILNKGFDKYFTDLIKDKTLKHEVWRNLKIIEHLGGKIYDDKLELSVDANAYKKVFVGILQKKIGNPNKKTIIGIALGAAFASKGWPTRKFLYLVNWMIKDPSAIVILIGSKAEAPIAHYIKSSVKTKHAASVIDTTGKTSIKEAASILARCNLLVGNDTGLIHIASALKIPVIHISSWPQSGKKNSSFSPYRFGPWKTPHIVLSPKKGTSPCKDECKIRIKPHCITRVKVADVKNAVKVLLP